MKRKARLPVQVAWAIVALLVFASPSTGTQNYAGAGLVLKVIPERNEIVLSMQEIPGFMDAMVMPLHVRQRRELDGLRPGMMVDFALIVTKDSSFAENFRVRSFVNVEPDPQGAMRLATVEKELASNAASEAELAPGQHVPDFSLTDQNHRQVTLSQFQGKIVALTFVYTGCSLPNFCFRLSNNFGQLQKRFRKQMGNDLILLTVTLDPTNDQPEALAKYASIWKADSASWHFLTGPPPFVKKVTGLFGVVYKPGEGTIIHSLHTVIIDRRGNLVANLEGNEFTAKQLGDLVEVELDRAPGS